MLSDRILSILEKTLAIAGTLSLAVFGAHLALAEYERTSEIEKFEETFQVSLKELPNPDQTLWSEKRVQAFEDSLSEDVGDVIGLFAIPRLGIEVPIYDGTTESQLSRGVGLIEGTSLPSEVGFAGLAGHRDGYFRKLKDIKVGDTMVFVSPERRITYSVQETLIVDPDAVEVLEPDGRPGITLVTCYPFYFVGSAPQRFIVRAELQPDLLVGEQQ